MSNKNFKPALLVLFILGFAISQAHANRFDPVYYQKRDFTFGASIGLLPTFASPYVNATAVPVTLVGEYRFAEKFSVGANVAFASTHFKSDLPVHAVIPRESNTRQFQANVRLGLHHSIDRTDFYGGLMLGYFQSKGTTNIMETIGGPEETPIQVPKTTNDTKFLYTAYVGAQHQLTDRLGIYAEAGFAITVLQFGLCYKINSKSTESEISFRKNSNHRPKAARKSSVKTSSARTTSNRYQCKSPGCKQSIR